MSQSTVLFHPLGRAAMTIGLACPGLSLAQTPCPTGPGPVVATSSCTVTQSPLAITTAGGNALSATGPSTVVTADGITFNVGAANAAGIFAGGGATVTANQSSVMTTSTTTATTAGQTGIRATDANSAITATGLTVDMRHATANNVTGVRAENGAAITLISPTISVGAAARQFNYGLVAASGGTITATDAAVVAGSNFSNAARVDGGTMFLNGGTFRSNGQGNATNGPAPAVAVVNGGALTVAPNASGTGTQLIGGGLNQAYGLQVTGDGSRATVTGATISATGGSGSAGVSVSQNASASITNSTISSTTYYGIWAATGASVAVTDSTVTGTLANALNASGGAQVTALRGTLQGSGQVPTILAGGATVNVTDAAIISRGDANAPGVYASAGARITVNGGTIDAYGTTARSQRVKGVAANLDDAQLTVNGAKIHTYGDEAIGAAADDGGTITLNRVTLVTDKRNAIGVYAGVDPLKPATATLTADATSIETFGDTAHGAQAQSQTSLAVPALVTLAQQSSILTHGEAAVGMRAVSKGRIDAIASTVTTEGAASHGMLARDAQSLITLNGAVISTTGQSAHGGVAQDGGTISGVNSTISASGAQAAGVFVSGFTSAASVDLTNSAVRSTNGPGIAMGGTAVMTLVGGTVTSPGDWLRAGQQSDFPALAPADPLIPRPEDPAIEPALAPTSIALSPAAVLETRRPLALAPTPGAATVDVSGTTLAGSATTLPGATSIVALHDGATWNLTGNSNLTELSNTGSQILFSPPAAGTFKTLTVNQYAGGAGSVIGLNTLLAGDGSPSDKLVIDGGNTNGTSGLRITNAGGAGAVTQANGILVVDAVNGGRTTNNAFTLDGRAVAGPYEYRLARGALDGSAPDAWYLRSEQTPVPPAPPSPPVPPSPPEPLYRPEVAAYLANQRLAGQMFVHSLHDRLGEPQYVEGQQYNRDEDKPKSGWLRVVGKWEGSRSKDGVFKTDTDSFLLHGGTEMAKWKVFGEADRAHLGVMGSYGFSSTDASAAGNAFRAKGKVEGWMLGAYGTWFQNDERKLGTYVDTWLQYGWFTNRVEGDQLPSVRYHANGLAVSAETGYAFPLRHDWILEPQGQIVYVGYDEGDITEPNGTRVSGADSHGWIYRLGARFHRTYVKEDQRKWQPYLTLNWWHTSVSSNISFNELPLGSMYPSNRYEIKLGVNADLGKRWTGWANVSGSWGAQSFYQYALRLGVKHSW